MTYAARAAWIRPGAPKSQRGVVLFVALIVLVAMTLAGLAVVRTTDTGMLIAGNLAFRKNAKLSADFGIEMARQWVVQTAAGNPAGLDNDVSPRYKSTWLLDADGNNDIKYRSNPHLWDWSDAGSILASNEKDSSGNTVRYVVHRMCASSGPVVELTCVISNGDPGPKNIQEIGGPPRIPSIQPYYRITARVEGPRNTVTFVQTFVN